MPRSLQIVLLLVYAFTSCVAVADIRVAVIKQPYGGERNVPEISANPDYIHAGGLEGLIDGWGGQLVRPVQDIRLTGNQAAQYGAWNRMALANGNMAEAVRGVRGEADLIVGLEANCNGLLGMLGGMPVAVAAGHALHNLRRTSGLAEPLPMEQIVWAGVRDLDRLEADRFAEFGARQISVQELRERSTELADAIAVLFEEPKAVALGIASTPAGALDADGVSRQAAFNLIEGAIRGIGQRP